MNWNCPFCNFGSNSFCNFGSNNPICSDCRENARRMIVLTNKLQNEKRLDNQIRTSSSSSTGLGNALKFMEQMKEMEDELNEKLNFLSGFAAAFKEQIHADILVKPGTDEPSLPAHRALLAARSIILKHMLDSDQCKAPPNDTITFQELNYAELESLLEFLYSGDLPKDKMDKHVFTLSIAADKYQIPFLQKFCQKQMLGSLSSSNVLDVLEIADTCSSSTLKENALNFIVKNVKDVVFSDRFDAFAVKNPHLTVQITRASLMEKIDTNQKQGPFTFFKPL
ncbi:BTB/POZ domain-containing protein At3g56230-like [Coffea eugenioides]|uniref:BTB/POZ domain-containing protein At3g56230-like n=1 Tax=Coffea arabica TaxID=13443 RepID=A0A6P6WI00_COFAR|nr:BTB/POZ domain-containing protein At3g56230-like [Coffea arabica]XP_027185571.1 BTB/POZ domain-containing protein At3g56230-like [Coffea eugenioides]